MARFKPGQLVTPKYKDGWEHSEKKYAPPAAPKYGDVVTIDCYPYPHLQQYCAFVEYPQCNLSGQRIAFYESDFEPLVSDAVLREELESVPEPFTI